MALFSQHAVGQQTGLSGVITDSQGEVIQGAKVEVKRQDGSSFFATTNGQGTYVVPNVGADNYIITVSTQGFGGVAKRVLLLMGQLAQVHTSLPVASASAAVVVEATDTLAIDTTSSVVAGNVTPTEVPDLPINGRNYVQLSALVPGIKSNSFGNTPAASGQSTNGGDAETGKSQITLDELQVSQDSVGSSFGQPKFSQDANATRTFAAGVTPIARRATCRAAPCTTVYAPMSKISYDVGYGYYVIQRDGFRDTDYHCIDTRLQESFKINDCYHAIVAVEAFNLLSHSNCGDFAVNASTGTGANAYGHPLASSGAPFEYQARSLHFIGRFSL